MATVASCRQKNPLSHVRTRNLLRALSGIGHRLIVVRVLSGVPKLCLSVVGMTGSCIQKICPFFHLATPDGDVTLLGWPAQKVANVLLMLQVLQTLVSPYRGAGAGGEVQLCQQAMKSWGLLEKLCKLLMTPGVPADVLTEIIHTVGDMIRACRQNQDYFADLLAPSNPPRYQCWTVVCIFRGLVESLCRMDRSILLVRTF
jgi:hypothetical protein